MNFGKRVNKINRGFVDLDGGNSRPGLFVPAAAGGRTPGGGVWTRRSLPPEGEGRGVGGEALVRA